LTPDRKTEKKVFHGV